MIQGVGDWLLVMLIYFGDGTGMAAVKRFPTAELCQGDAIMVGTKAGSAGAIAVSFKCTQLHGRDPVPVVAAVTEELQHSEVAGEDPVPGY